MHTGQRALALFALLVCVLTPLTTPRADVVLGQAAPALSGPQLDGKNFDLAALKGKVVIVHVWATWCPACRDEMPAIEAVWRQYRGKGLEVLALSVDRPHARGDVEQVMHYFSYPAALWTGMSKNDFGNPAAVPVTFIIDKAGVVQTALSPAGDQILTEQGLGAQVKTLLAAPDVKPAEAAAK